MKTIVKGKIVYKDYKKAENIVDIFHTLYLPYSYYSTNTTISVIERSLSKIKKEKNDMVSMFICTVEDHDYETFYETSDLDYTLKENNYIHIDEATYKIEKVEGTDKNCIIYYTDKIIKEYINDVKYKKVQDEVENIINGLIKMLQEDYDFYCNKAQEEKAQEKLIKEQEEEKKEYLDSFPTIQDKKWWQFWK